jgi:hypothetical protein
MNLTIPCVSIASLLRMAISAVLFLPLTNCQGRLEDMSTSSVTVETPSSAFAFVNSIGVNTHLNYFNLLYGNFPLVQRELTKLGVLHLRDGAHLQGLDYNALLYGRWAALRKSGMRFDTVFDPRSNLGPMNSALLDQVNALAGNAIEFFEGPNEMDISNENNWVQIDRDYQLALFDSDSASSEVSSIGIVGPSLAVASNSSKIGDIANDMNYGNLHPYPAGEMPSVVFPKQVSLEKIVCDGKPIIFTESGYHNAINEHNDQPGISETAAAKYIPRLFLEDYLHGIPRTYLYELLDEAPDPSLTNPQMHWGLIRADGSEKPAFLALTNLIAELADSQAPVNLTPLNLALQTNNPQVHHLLLEKSNGAYDLILWQEVPSYDIPSHADINNPNASALLTLGRQARSITAYQPVTQEAPIHTWSNVRNVSLEIPDHPFVVEISF